MTVSVLPPTPAQHAWLKKNKSYVRTSHVRVKFSSRGTLYPDGSFVGEKVHPVMDGGGAFGVGILVAKRRR